MYSTAYHPQTNEQSERINQTVEIALRFHLAAMENPADWPDVLPRIQGHLNNAQSTVTAKSPNEAAYGFTPVQSLSLLKPFGLRKASDDVDISLRMIAKKRYDRKHQPFYMKPGDYALIRLHRGYDIPSTAVLGPKLSQQFAGPFKILEKVGRLTYRLELPTHWRIHSVLSVVMLKSVSSFDADSYKRDRPSHFDFVFVEGDTVKMKSFEIERLINRREIKRRGHEYLIRWREYGPEYDEWRNLSELDDVMNLIRDYDEALKFILWLSGKLNTAFDLQKFFGKQL